MVRLTVKQQRDIWIAIAQSLKTADDLLRHSSVTVILKVDNKVEKREIGLHDPPSRVLGVHHFFCSGMNCRSQARELRYSNKLAGDINEAVRQKCEQCGVQSLWVRIRDVDWVHLLPGSRRIFWHHYPLTSAQMTLFMNPNVAQTAVKSERR